MIFWFNNIGDSVTFFALFRLTAQYQLKLQGGLIISINNIITELTHKNKIQFKDALYYMLLNFRIKK